MNDGDEPDGRRIANGNSVTEIIDGLQALVVDRSLQPGDRIGAEREFAESFGVSRWMVRKALEQLENDGRILRTHGRNGGIFVPPKKVVRGVSPLLGLPDYLRSQGIESGTTVLGTRAGLPNETVAKQLGLGAAAWVFKIDRLRLAGGLPFVLESANFPCDLFPGLLDQPLVGSLYELLETQYNVKRGVAVETITATSATRETAATLQVSVGAPLISVKRTMELSDGRPFEHTTELYRSDRTAITIRTEGDAAYTLTDASIISQ